MLTVRMGKTKLGRRQNFRGWVWLCTSVVSVVVLVTFGLQQYSNPFKADWLGAFFADSDTSSQTLKTSSKQSAGSCAEQSDCPGDHFSFLVRSGAANVVAPKICIQNKLVLGTTLNNAGYGINVVIIDGKTGQVQKTDHFDMYGGDVKPLVELLRSISPGSVVLMASYDEPSSKLNEEAKQLISDLGSSAVKSLGFRDNWVFVGGKGAAVKSSFEKHVKNDRAKNKYENWPELIEMQGCIPKFLE